jgi:hypothetical protein
MHCPSYSFLFVWLYTIDKCWLLGCLLGGQFLVTIFGIRSYLRLHYSKHNTLVISRIYKCNFVVVVASIYKKNIFCIFYISHSTLAVSVLGNWLNCLFLGPCVAGLKPQSKDFLLLIGWTSHLWALLRHQKCDNLARHLTTVSTGPQVGRCIVHECNSNGLKHEACLINI